MVAVDSLKDNSYVVRNLDPDTMYVFNVRAVMDDGSFLTQGLKKVLRRTEKQPLTPKIPLPSSLPNSDLNVNFSLVSAGHDKINITWTLSRLVVLSNVVVFWRKKDSEIFFSNDQKDPGSFYLLTGLDANSTYVIKVRLLSKGASIPISVQMVASTDVKSSETTRKSPRGPIVTTPSGSETTRKSPRGPIVTTPSDSLSKEAAAAIGAACLCFLLLVAVACWWRFKKQKMEATFASLDSDFKFDAFIIYSSMDQKWVTKKLLPTLESKYKIKCCIHYRDFVPGVPFTKNMADSVYNSKKTVAVVSKSFLTSNFCSHELSIALHRLAERRDDSVVVIKLDDVKNSQLPKELRFRSYIDFTKSTDKRTWEYKLVKCLSL
ncbi:toll-like receptor 2 [Montipora capricornis]|uniref:toll-like receptor 2 n=1 Tax=Montipora capricornis TaxID=246305 RepID=UPI0035F1392A